MQMNMGFVSLRHGLAILGGFAALAIAAVWLFATPIFAEPDEQAHLDYALTIVDEGLPARAPSSARIVATDTDTTLRYLEDALHYRELRFDNSYRVANAFFSRAGRLAIDAGVPTNVVDQKMRRTLPAVAPYYPAGYYVVAAAVYAVSRSVFHLGAIESIYAMRVLGLLALVVTLAAAYRIFLELGFFATYVCARDDGGRPLSARELGLGDDSTGYVYDCGRYVRAALRVARSPEAGRLLELSLVRGTPTGRPSRAFCTGTASTGSPTQLIG